MYVCICQAVTDSQIRREVADGARRMRDLNRRLGICSQCGKCGRHARQVLQEATLGDADANDLWGSGGVGLAPADATLPQTL